MLCCWPHRYLTCPACMQEKCVKKNDGETHSEGNEGNGTKTNGALNG